MENRNWRWSNGKLMQKWKKLKPKYWQECLLCSNWHSTKLMNNKIEIENLVRKIKLKTKLKYWILAWVSTLHFGKIEIEIEVTETEIKNEI